MEITVYRDKPLCSEARTLPATTYNLMHSLLARNNGPLFVPIRSMQVLAIVDAEEVVFLTQHHRNQVELAWQRFRPQARDALDEAVPFEAACYTDEGADITQRIQGEFHAALLTQSKRSRPDVPASVLRFAPRTTT